VSAVRAARRSPCGPVSPIGWSLRAQRCVKCLLSCLEDQQLEMPHPVGLSHRGHYATGFRLLSEDDAPLSVSAQEPLVVAAADSQLSRRL